MMEIIASFVLGFCSGAAWLHFYRRRYRAWYRSQSAKAVGRGNIVIQSGARVSGDMVGGDLIKRGSDCEAVSCRYCGAAPTLAPPAAREPRHV